MSLALMLPLRRRLASCALALCLVQVSALFAAPVAVCCSRTDQPHAAATAADCCPAGSHAPGQCPLHKNEDRHGASCRLTCSHPAATALLLLQAGVLSTPPTVVRPVASRRAEVPRGARAILRVSDPSAPPPKA